jgi:hypothetical protein
VSNREVKKIVIRMILFILMTSVFGNEFYVRFNELILERVIKNAVLLIFISYFYEFSFPIIS